VWRVTRVDGFSLLNYAVGNSDLIPQSALRQVHILFQSHRVQSNASTFSFQYPLVFLRPSSSSLHIFLVFPHFYPSIFNNVFQEAVPIQNLTNPVSLPFFFIVCRILLDRAGFGQGQVAGIYDCGNEPPGSIKCWEFLD